MMGQELFENPHRQYELYRVTAHEKLSQTLGDPEEFPAERPTAEQEAAMEGFSPPSQRRRLPTMPPPSCG